MKNYIFLFMLFAFMVFPQTSFAGGNIWEAHIVNLNIQDDAFEITLIPLEKHSTEICEKYVIKGKYQKKSFLGINFSRYSEYDHNSALFLLKNKYKAQKPVGVISIGNAPYGHHCEFESFGLDTNKETDNVVQFYDSENQVAYSF